MKKNIILILSFIINLSVTRAAFAATTTLTFDEYGDGTAITTQYQGVGVTAEGLNVITAAYLQWPANTGANVAIAGAAGLMSFALNPSIIGSIQKVSAYISGTSSVGIYAYDANGALVGQAQTAGASNNALVTVTSSGNPIVNVAIHDGGSSFVIDTLSFTTAAPVLNCVDNVLNLQNAVAAVSTAEFKQPNKAAKQRVQLRQEILYLKSMIDTNAPNWRLICQVKVIRENITDWIKPGANRNNLLNALEKIVKMINANQC